MGGFRWSAVAVLAVSVLGACTGGSGDHGVPTTGTVKRECRRPTAFDTAHGNELHGTTTNGELWGIAMGPHIPPRVGDPLKIVWRMTGHGPLHVAVVRPDGSTSRLTFGPERHDRSTYRRPGDEWGTGFRFDRAGCWSIRLTRADTSGAVRLEIA
jgi:hypothetical protein